MKKKYIQPDLFIVECSPELPLLTASNYTQQVNVYSNETVDAEDALVKENAFDFSWE